MKTQLRSEYGGTQVLHIVIPPARTRKPSHLCKNDSQLSELTQVLTIEPSKTLAKTGFGIVGTGLAL